MTINTAVVLANAEEIINENANLLQSTELLMGAKLSIKHFEEVKKEYVLDIKLVFPWIKSQKIL